MMATTQAVLSLVNILVYDFHNVLEYTSECKMKQRYMLMSMSVPSSSPSIRGHVIKYWNRVLNNKTCLYLTVCLSVKRASFGFSIDRRTGKMIESNWVFIRDKM